MLFQLHNKTLLFIINNWNFVKMRPRKHLESWRRHQMETFSALLAICADNLSVTREFPAQINDCANNSEADDLSRHRAHYDVTVMPAI